MSLNHCISNGSYPTAQIVGDPVDVISGENFDQALDFRLTGSLELWWNRHYNSSQNHRRLALGWGQTHEFDRILRFDTDGISYEAPIGHIINFPPLYHDGSECTNEGFILRRVSIWQYQLFHHGEPSMEFEFHHPLESVRLKRLFQGKSEILFYYDAQGRLERIIDSVGRTILVTSNTDGYITTLTFHRPKEKANLLLVEYQYDDHGNLIRTLNNDGHGYVLTYDEANRLVKRTGRTGFSFYFTYDQQGRCIKAVGDHRLHGVVLNYTISGSLTKVIRADLGVWNYFYDALGLTQIIDPLGGVQKFLRDDMGRLSGELDPNGNETRFIYNTVGARIAKITPLGHRLSLPEDPNAPDPLEHRVAANPAEYEYGRLLNIPQITIPDTKQATVLPLTPKVRTLVCTRPELDKIQNLENQYHPRPLGVLWWPEPKAGRVFNDLGKLLQQYDDFGRQRQWAYDASGNIAEHIDYDGGKWHYHHGLYHFMTELTTPIGTQVKFSYTYEGKIASCIDAGGTCSEYRYDFKDKLVEVRRHGVVRETYTRDAVGNLIGKHASDGRELLRIEIGSANLPIKRTLASGDEHTMQYDTSGRYLLAATKKDTVIFEYDAFGNRVIEKRNDKGAIHRFQGLHAPAESVLFDHFVVSYTRTADDAFLITDPTGKSHLIKFLPHGLIERRFSNGTQETAQFDNIGRCLFKVTQRNNNQTWSRRYHWSGEGELRKVEDNHLGEVRHEYDAAHRLQRRWFDGNIEHYTMDSADNLISQPGLTSVSLLEGNRLKTANGCDFEYNDRNHIALKKTFTGEVRYSYDSRDQLVRVEMPEGIWEADYDALGRRTRKIWAGQTTEYYWNTDQLIAEVDSTGRLRLYVYADLLALTPILFIDYDTIDAQPESGRLYFIFTDQIGTPCLIEDEQGTAVWRAQIAPFGYAEIEQNATIEFNFRFPGHYFDAELDLHYNQFRYYDPVLGRYLQSDPWGITGGTNLYAYFSNPLFKVDATGLGENGGLECSKRKPDEESSAFPNLRRGTDPEGNQSVGVDVHADRVAKALNAPLIANDPNNPNSRCGIGTKRSVTAIQHEDGSVSVGISGSDPTRQGQSAALVDHLNSTYPPENGKPPTYRATPNAVDTSVLSADAPGNPPGQCSEAHAAQAAGENPSPPTAYQTVWGGTAQKNPHPIGDPPATTSSGATSLMCPCGTCQANGRGGNYDAVSRRSSSTT